jgi:Animal haem peroxidase
VYRLHSLVPENIGFFDVNSGTHKATTPIQDVAFAKARQPFDSGLAFADVFCSFGISYPGAITIHNTPNFLRDLFLPDGRHLDMGTPDILRDRERGAPRYNEFRRLFHMSPHPHSKH